MADKLSCVLGCSSAEERSRFVRNFRLLPQGCVERREGAAFLHMDCYLADIKVATFPHLTYTHRDAFSRSSRRR